MGGLKRGEIAWNAVLSACERRQQWRNLMKLHWYIKKELLSGALILSSSSLDSSLFCHPVSIMEFLVDRMLGSVGRTAVAAINTRIPCTCAPSTCMFGFPSTHTA